jgi:hypothetical protein
VTARAVLDGIKALTERLDYVREWGSSDPMHALANTRLKALHAAVTGVMGVHEPVEAVMYSGSRQRLVKVCTGCGTDDGNWQRWPCPTVRAIEKALEGA